MIDRELSFDARPARIAARAFLVALPILATAAPCLAEDGPRGAGWISGDAVAYVEVARPAEILGRLADGPARGLIESSPAFRKYLAGDAYRAARAVVDAVAGASGSRWDEALLDLVGGGLVGAVEPTHPPRAFLIATPRDPARLAGAIGRFHALARLDAANRGQPDPIRSTDRRGVAVHSTGPGPAHAIVEGTLVVADSVGSLEAMVDRTVDRPDPAGMLAADPLWHSRRRAELAGGAAAWGLVRLDGVRRLDPRALAIPERVNSLLTLLFAHWVEAARRAPWASAGLAWTPDRLDATLSLATPPGGYSELLRRFLPAPGTGAPVPAMPRGALASLALRRDLTAIWEVRAELFPPEVVQGFAQLDTLAGTFFGGRDFGTGVLGALGADWRLVVARQDPSSLDPMPDDKLPAFALVADLKPDDEEFAVRLRSAFQSSIGLANLNSAQTKAPPLMLGSETCEGVSIATARYLRPKGGPRPGEPVDSRHNFSPSAAQVGDRFILSSSVGLARELVATLKAPAGATVEGSSLVAVADGAGLAALVEENRARLVMQNMLEKGNDRPSADREVDTLAWILRALGRGDLSAVDSPEAVRFRLDFATPHD